MTNVKVKAIDRENAIIKPTEDNKDVLSEIDLDRGTWGSSGGVDRPKES
jgi:hypothetical protein